MQASTPAQKKIARLMGNALKVFKHYRKNDDVS